MGSVRVGGNCPPATTLQITVFADPMPLGAIYKHSEHYSCRSKAFQDQLLVFSEPFWKPVDAFFVYLAPP